MSRILFSAVLAFAAFATSVESFAADYRHGRQSYSRYARSHEFYLEGYGYGRRRVGGHLFGWQLNPSIFGNAGYNYPGHYSNQSFWERVQTQANYPVQY
jgi:hypothetical protein